MPSTRDLLRSPLVRRGVTLVVIVGAVGFFARELSGVVLSLKDLRPVFGVDLALAYGVTVAAYCLGSEIWRYSMNRLAAPARIGVLRGFAVMNVSSIAKYIPGKLWSIGMQASWLAKAGIASGKVVSINLLNSLISVAVSFSIGGIWLLLTRENLPRPLAWLGVAGIVLAHVALAFNARRAIGLAAMLLKRVFDWNLELPELSAGVMATLQASYVVYELAFGLAAFFGGRSFGLEIGAELLPTFLCGVPVANAIGFVMVLVPGGIGVREGALYLALRDRGGEVMALTVPIWSRLVTMAAELSIFVAATLILKRPEK